jgi:hypothetical protein
MLPGGVIEFSVQRPDTFSERQVEFDQTLNVFIARALVALKHGVHAFKGSDL